MSINLHWSLGKSTHRSTSNLSHNIH